MTNSIYNTRQVRGDFGEDAVCDYLTAQGCQIIERNFCKRSGEIDIIATDGRELVFVEVKTRKFGSLTDGQDAVNRTKRKKLVETARAFLRETQFTHQMNARFDVASVVVSTDESPQLLELEYFENAFDAALV
ncbi:MAG: YraN family protein [Oscillospiraceae bacterium]|nr:YraN family protein [Oscillospiraceae bacterium]